MTRVLRIIAGILLSSAGVFAQSPPEAFYGESFQSYRTQVNVPGWTDTAVGVPRPEGLGLYKTWPDPLDNRSTNIVYGTKQASGTPEGRNPRIGTFSTLSTYSFAGQGRFEYRGRIIRTTSEARVGLTFFSSYPEQDRYYLIGLWSQPTGSNLTMQLFGFGGGSPTGTTDSNSTLEPNKWYRFLIQVDDAEATTRVRARFWLDGAAEPEVFSIDATDSGTGRLREGRIGMWAAVRGEAYIDDITAKSPVDHTAPKIELFESGQPLTDGSKFNRDAVPEIRVTDDLSAVTYTATLDGVPYTSRTPVTVEGWHALAVRAADGPRNVSTIQVNFLVDKTAPVVVLQEGADPLVAGSFFNRDVVINAAVTDVSETTLTATLNGGPYQVGTPITAEGTYSIAVTTTDALGWSTTAGPVTFTIDKTPPRLTFTSHAAGAVVTGARVVVAGGSDDAVTVTVGGFPASVDAAAKTFTSTTLALLEGDHAIVATGVDRAGNIGTATLPLVLDTRAPALTISAPAADACIDATSLQVSGTASDPRLASVKVTIGSATAAATVQPSGAWSATVPVADEGKKLITVEATDTTGHSASMSRSVVIDRTHPVIELRENGEAFNGGVINRAVAVFIRATDADAAVVVTTRLNGTPYVSGTQVSSEGVHTLTVSATDCAGHKSEKSIDFTVDLTAPTIRNLSPANGATVGTRPATITGVTDSDVVRVEIAGTGVHAVPGSNGAFSIGDVPFAEGLNRFSLEATDRAGHRASTDYAVTVQTIAPIVEIRESGSAIPPDALFNRAVAPTIRSVDPQATITATLNGATYTSGTSISNDGAYTLRATATDALGHAGSAEAAFTIDRTPPAVKITAPATSTVQTDRIAVRGTVGDSLSAALNGQPVTLGTDGTFVFDGFALEVGANAIVLIGRDRAGNSGRDEVVITRDDLGAGVLLTYPPDQARTNRPATDVTGRVLTPSKVTRVTVGTTPVDADPLGFFRLSAYPLVEGENTITVTATAANGVTSSASVRVTGDFTPPALAILESGQPLTDGARFSERAVISLQASDAGGSVVTELTINGVKVSSTPFTMTAAGGHTVVASARDLAGNESRVERTLFIGAAGGIAGCNLDGFDPPDGAVILANKTELVGRTGGAAGVKVNGIRAAVADGSFSVNVELPAEGANSVTIACTDADGNPTGTPKTITLHRVTGEPSITIDTPSESFVTAQETISVSGTVGAGVVSADVNGVAATISGSDSNVPRSFSVANVRLAAGLNMLVAHGRNAGGRIGTASRRGLYIKDAPTLSISSPTAGMVTGIPRVTVSGTFTNVDPASVVVSNLASGQTFAAQVVRFSDTTGSFSAADVALSSGEQTLRVSGRDRMNREAFATVTVRLVAGTPGITIAQPAAHSSFGSGSDSFTVSGTFQAAEGSLVDANGVTATLSGTGFTASVKFSTLSGGITPVVARVTQPDGASASASIIVTQLGDAPKVVEIFPAPDAVEVDTGALLLVLFSQPMDRASIDSAFRLQDASGAPVSGALHLDKDVLTFAPATLLTPGARYTLRLSTAAKNLAGTPIASESVTSFTTATSAPSTAPTVEPLGSAICGQSVTVNGTASPGARLRLEAATLTLNATADAAGKFTFTYPLSGQSGFAVLRIRVVGSDGSVSPAAELKVRIDCSGPQVLNASFDGVVNKLTIQFSESIDAASTTVGTGNAITLTLQDGVAVGGTAAVAQNIVTITPAGNLAGKTFTLSVNTTIKDTIGNRLVTPFSQVFAATGAEPAPAAGSGFISGEVYDATTGRPLAGAVITIEVPSSAPVVTAADSRGRYLVRVREGAHTIKASLDGYTSVWREIVVPAGAGAIPIDIRLTRRGPASATAGSALTLSHGGDTAVTRPVQLTVPAAALPPGRNVAVTSVGSQALIGLLPLGWSPIAAAEIAVDNSEQTTTLAGAQLTFQVPAADITAAGQNLTAVQYNAARDEWRVLDTVVNVASDGKVVLSVPATGAYALVYPDKAPGVTQPPLAVAGDVLRGVPSAPVTAPPLVKRDFRLDPPVVLPNGRSVATLRIEGSGASFPSGTAVQAYIDEELKLADGSRLLDPPFATDLLLYRTLSGDLGVADFHLAPSAKAAEVILEVGVDRIRVFPYPGRLDRGTLIGSEGGRVPADEKVSIEIAAGATSEPLRATATSLTASDISAIGAIAGFRVVGGFQLTLQRATESAPTDLDGNGSPDPVAAPELFIPARATFTVQTSAMPSPGAQVILAELLDQTPYGRMVRLSVPMMLVDPAQTGTPALRFTTRSIDRAVLPVDGVTHEGRYILLAAENPIAFATGTVRLSSATGRLLANARVVAQSLGVAELSRSTGIYNIPVPAKPAAPFTLIPRHTTTGDGVAFTNPSAVDAGSVTRADLALVAQPPALGSVVVLKGEPPSQATLTAGTTTGVALATNVRASFTPAIDPASVTADSITVTDATTGAKVNGAAAADGTVAVLWTLKPGERLKANGSYIVSIAGSIRGSNGAALGRGATFNFDTVTEILNSEIRRERIRITIPANGISTISGTAGALPAGWQAVAVRRYRDFRVRYQATAASDGSFSFLIGNGGDASDHITMGDFIDLQVISTTGNIAAIFALTPFTSEDGKSFVAPVGVTVRYTTPENITLSVPAGAFDEPTVVTVTAAKKEDFLDIANLEAENEYVGSARVDFEGVAKKPLGFEVPLPAGFETAGKVFLLAEKGMSPVGPRLAMIDLMRPDNGKLITDHENTTLSATYLDNNRRVGVDRTLTGSKFTKYLQSMIRSGIFMALDIKVYGIGGSVGFGVMETLQTQYDLIWSIYASYWIPHIHVAERGGALMPIITGRPFTVTGFDPGTGLQAVTKAYDPIPFGEPGTVTPIPSTQQNDGGPYPVFGGPFRVELVDLEIQDVSIESVRNFKVRLSNDIVTVSPGATPLESDIKVSVLNASKGRLVRGTAGSSIQLPANLGDRIVLMIEERRVDLRSPISVVFSEPIYVGNDLEASKIDDFLHNLLMIEYAHGSGGSFIDITPQVHFSVDSGRRRVRFELPSALQAEARYRITLKPEIADIVDDAPGLKLGVGTIENNGVLTPVGGGSPFEIFFDVRQPAGELNSFSAASYGLIRGMELSGNVLFVAAWDGGLRSYDVSNPTNTPPALGSMPGTLESGVGHLSVTVDRHNRVYATAQQPASGAFRSYRVEDFVNGNPQIKGSKLISWRIGFSQGLGLPSNTMLSDIPEAIPFRIKVLLDDDEQTFENRKDFVGGTGASETGSYPAYDLKKYRVVVSGSSSYQVQRITVENLTLDMRWSGDALGGGAATIDNVVARSTDRLRVIKNKRTYAIVALLGYGIGIYDANAIEHNTYLKLPKNDGRHIREQMVLTAGLIDELYCTNDTPSHGIIENYITTDAELGANPDDGSLYSYSTATSHGVLDLNLTLPSNATPGTRDDDCSQRPDNNAGGFLLQTYPPGNEVARMQAVRSAISSAAGRQPIGHFGMLARYHWAITAADNKYGTRGIGKGRGAQRDYLLIAGHELGLIVVEIDSDPAKFPRWPLESDHLADVIWIPGGVTSVRVYQSANLAVVSDRYGRVLIVDLSHLDERWDAKNNWQNGAFPTLRKALAGRPDGPGIGADDPRVIWKSEPGVHLGAAAPVMDPFTGMVFAGKLLTVKALAGIDPKVTMKVNLGDTGLTEVGGVVPLGVPIPQRIQNKINGLQGCDGTTLGCKENASLAAFRLEVSLPGNMVDALSGSNNELRLAVESERIAGAVTEQTPAGFPRAHLRRSRRDGSSEQPGRAATSFKFTRVVPDELRNVLRSQRGYNRFMSPWIVAIADPRASEEYEWRDAPTKEKKKEAGCDECERPQHLKGKAEQDDVYELWTNGRSIAVRPEYKAGTDPIFEGTRYNYLGQEQRLLGRFSTVMADTVRPTETVVAGQNPPIADGELEEIAFVHSGEIETTQVDLDAGGRAGFNVMYDRTYRSRTLGGSAFGQGWDSSFFRRLRALPNGDVEYRDGAEVWRFRINASEGYDSPKGLFLKLSRTARGWKMIDQSWRITEFDDIGRLLSETDEFFDPQQHDSGNVIRYFYDESGRLSQIIDPVQRETRITYWKEGDGGQGAYPGLVKEIADWRDRKINYEYDPASGALVKVKLAEVANTTGSRPVIDYAYTPSGSSYTDKLELRTNLASITAPQQAIAGGSPRVKFTYDTGGDFRRDRVLTQQWGTGETATFTYPSKTNTIVTDVLGQTREYVMSEEPPKNYFSDRPHVLSVAEKSVKTSAAPFGDLPARVEVGVPPTTSTDRTTTFSYDGEGQVRTETLNGVRTVSYSYIDVRPSAPGFIPGSQSVTPMGGPSAAVTVGVTYQSGANRSTFVKSVSAGGLSIDAPQPSRSYRQVSAANNNINSTNTFDANGLPVQSAGTGGVDSGSAGGNATIRWAPASAAKHERGKVTAVDFGGQQTTIRYPSPTQTFVTDSRGVTLTTIYDDWDRPVSITMTGPQLTVNERFEYDASGRLVKHTRKQGATDVTETYGYDVMDRETSYSIDNVAGTGTATTRTSYNLPGRTIITTEASGSVRTTKLDSLGRTESEETTTGAGASLKDSFAYDLLDNVVFTSDLFNASAKAFDAYGQLVGSKRLDGIVIRATVDAWGRVTGFRKEDATGRVIAESTLEHTAAGQLKSVTRKLDVGERVTTFAWDGAGRSTGMSVAGRAQRITYDAASRIQSRQEGAGSATSISTAFRSTEVSGHSGTLPQSATSREKGGSGYSVALEYNTLGQSVAQNFGDLQWKRSVDQAGNVTSFAPPRRPAYGFEYDSRHALKTEMLPDGATNTYGYHATGALASYTDPSGEVTGTDNDLIGRPILRKYKDGTEEKIEWEGRRVKSITDRQRRVQTFTYNSKGQMSEVRSGDGTLIEKIEYDDAGRVIKRSSPDAAIEYSDFNTEGQPKKTAQSRLSNGSVVDRYAQEHTWNEHGERSAWTMPTYSGFSTMKPWTKSVSKQYDAMGNVTRIERTLTTTSQPSLFLDADYRDSGRPDYRKVTTPSFFSTIIERNYGYDGSNGLLNRLAVDVRGKTVAGSEIEYDGVQKSRARLLGLSNGSRSDEWIYDARSRLKGSLLARDTGGTPQSEEVTAGDFRAALSRPFSDIPVEPRSIVYTEDARGGHKIAVMQQGNVIEQFAFNGGERIEDGRFKYEYDARGRLSAITQNVADTVRRRVRYSYDPKGRMVGRRAEYAVVAAGQTPTPQDWKIEDRPAVLAAEALPADTTFVWDPMSDQLVALFKAGSSETLTIDDNGGLLRQIIHGGLGLDDPLEIATVDTTTSSGVSRLYPIYDEAGGRSLQVVLNDRGEIVARSIAAGPYGEDQAVLAGPAVDKVQVSARKDDAGNVVAIDIVLRSTEQIAEQSVASGFRLAAVHANGDVVRASSSTPVLEGEASIKWSLTGEEWASLTAGGGAVSIATTSTARGAAWGDSTKFLAAPSWAVQTRPVFTSAALPVEVRESLAGLSQWLASIPAGGQATHTLYEVPTLYALGAPRTAEGTAIFTGGDPLRFIVSSPFHAHPFQDPFTGQNFVRARWFDLHSGAWLTPDPAGYADSSNLYAYAGGDPVNFIDSSGRQRLLYSNQGAEEEEESRAGRFFRWLAKEAVATAVEELTPVGIANGIVTAFVGYDAIRDEPVEGWVARGLALVSALPLVPSSIRKLDNAADAVADASRVARNIPTSKLDDAARIALRQADNAANNVPREVRRAASQADDAGAAAARRGPTHADDIAETAPARSERTASDAPVQRQKTIVLGQNMPDRVIPAARAIQADYLRLAPADWTWPKNRDFLYRAIRRYEGGRLRIFDIGGQRGRYQGPKSVYTIEKKYLRDRGFRREFTGRWITLDTGKRVRLYEWIR